MKRFWQTASVDAGDGGWTVLLDARPLRTPAKAPLQLPTAALADAIAAEWQAAPAEVEIANLPLTALAYAAIDVVRPGRPAIIGSLAAYAETDLTCYRADTPAALVAAQQAAWEPALQAVEKRHSIAFQRISGIRYVEQPAATIAAVRARLNALSDFELAALQPLVTIAGSIVLALAHVDGTLTAEQAFHAAHVDEDWQKAQWGSDSEAQARQAARQRDYLAASHFLQLLRNCPAPP